MDTWSIMYIYLLVYRGLPIVSPDVVWKMIYFGEATPFLFCLPGDPVKSIRKRKGGSKGSREAGVRLIGQTSKSAQFSQSRRRRPPDFPF